MIKNMGLLVHKEILIEQTVMACLMLFFSVFLKKDKKSNQTSEGLVKLVERIANGDPQNGRQHQRCRGSGAAVVK